ncbi:MAG: hypothetical protein LBH98_02050 [Chitinispirillales bacterium]|jgi:flagellar hook assembly protein FlgD|nr:hypothetical protein [Chitinispirillales bacterium]
MNKLKSFFNAACVICFTAATVFAANDYDVKNMKIAVIWNPATQNTDAPLGWPVGEEDYQLSGGWKEGRWDGDSKDAPEISKAQLKFFLWSLNPDNPDLKPNKTLDTTNTPEYGDLEYLGLPHVRVYSSDDDITYDKIERDFDGSQPNAIVYIGAGAEIEDGDNMFDMFKEAAQKGVGIFFIGQRSVTDARDLDPEKTTFPVMGVQNNFTIKRYSDDVYSKYGTADIIKEFNFLKTNDGNDAYGYFWEKADTVTIAGNDDKGYKMYLIENDSIDKNKPIYDSKKGGWQSGYDIVTPAPTILHKYGEWSINAKAVEVIENDEYEARMGYGWHNEVDLLVGILEQDNKVYIKGESPSLFLNGEMRIDRGLCLSDSGLIMNGDVVKDHWKIGAKNPETGGNDSLIVLRKGQKIGYIKNVSADAYYGNNNSTNKGKGPSGQNGDKDDWAQYSAGTQINFNAGGLRDLRIVINNGVGKIYDEIFGSHYGGTFANMGMTELKFKPYGSSAGDNGRIQAGASIWAFNKYMNPKSFSDIEKEGFKKENYYANYLGEQRAGKPGNIKAQFVRPHATGPKAGEEQDDNKAGEFDEDGNYFRESELPATNSGRNPYYNAFKDKIYNQISVVQHGRQRLAMIGYQPTYLKDQDASRAILHDMTLWIGYDHYGFPAPDIKIEEGGGMVSANGKEIGTDQNYIIVVFDPSEMSDDMKNYEHKFYGKWEYGGREGNAIWEIIEKNVGDDLLYIKISLLDDIGIDPSKAENTTIKITAGTEANELFDDKDPKEAVITLKQLQVKPVVKDEDEFKDIKDGDILNMNDTLIIDTYWKNLEDEGSDAEVVVKVYDKDGKLWSKTVKSGDKIPFAEMPDGEITIKITAKKDGFVNSHEKSYEVTNIHDNIPPYIVKARYNFGKTGNNGQLLPGESDILIITFSEKAYYNTGELRVFYLWDKNGYKEVKVEYISQSNDEWRFKVIGIEGKKEPTRGDSINVHPAAGLHDDYDNYINDDNWSDNTINRKALLEIGQKDLNLTMTVITTKNWNKDNDKQLNDVFVPVDGNEDITDVNGSEAVVIAILNPRLNNVNKDNTQLKSATILDAVGNKVIETSGFGEEGKDEHLKVALFKMGNAETVVLGISWDGKNANGRSVGSGAYKLFVVTEWPTGDVKQEGVTSSLIYVPERTKNK